MAKRPIARKSEPREVVVEAAALPPVPAPIPLTKVIGQGRALEVLEGALKSGRVHHAWIFQGPPGVGKFTTALSFAAMLLDPTLAPTLGGELEVDEDSRVQQLLRAGTHPDLAVVTKELARFHEDADVRERKQRVISVDVIRQFVLDAGALAASMRSESRAGKVFIIDEAELLNGAAQNALLKFLEEPAARVVIVLVTSNPEALFPTIRSRCQRVSFVPLSEKDMQAWLKRSGTPLSATERWLVEFAAGSPGALCAAQETGIGAWWGRLEPLLEQAEAGKVVLELGPAMEELVKAWAEAWVKARPNASKEAANRAGADWMVRLLAWHASRGLRGDEEAVERAMGQIEALRATEAELDANVSATFVFEKLAAEFSAGTARA